MRRVATGGSALDPTVVSQLLARRRGTDELDRLTPREREVVRLSHLEQLTHPEIADRLGIPIGTVKSRSHSAYAKLRAALSPTVEQV